MSGNNRKCCTSTTDFNVAADEAKVQDRRE